MTQLIQPRISILLAVYNAEQFIAETIESVLAQSYGAWELLIEDGNSRDRTMPIAKKYADCDPRIKLVSEPDEGQGHAMAKAAARARGDFIMILAASDGYLDRDWLLKCVKVMDADFEVSLVWGIPFNKDASGKLAGSTFAFEQFFKEGGGRAALFKEAWKRLRHPSSLFRIFNQRGSVAAVGRMLRRREIPEKQAWFDHWLATGLAFPDGNMCVARRAYFDCMPPYWAGSREQVDWMGFYFDFNAKGYLAYGLPAAANFARADHEGQLGKRIAGFVERKREEYFERLKKYRAEINAYPGKAVFRDRAGRAIECDKK